ncbi:hypothetical protein PG999_004059, partial [Apiospora kogelbergensis]
TLSLIIFYICGGDDDNFRHDARSAQFFIDEKLKPYQLPYSCPSRGSADAVVADIISILRSAEKEGVKLAKKVRDTIAEGILNSIKAILDKGPKKIGNAMKVAYNRASEAADTLFQFTKDHPITTAGLLTIIAVGILVILTPAVVEALGFAELGPIKGTLFFQIVNYTYAEPY